MRRSSFAESAMQEANSLYERLRVLAVEDPREARKLFLFTFEANEPNLADLLTALRSPGEGRLRQVVANAVRSHPEKARLVNELIRWRETETDEFTRRAIEGALAGVDRTTLTDSSYRQPVAIPSELGDVYRYVSDRLRHRLRNTMLSVQTQASRLKRAIGTNVESEIQGILGRLNDSIIAMGRDLEATSLDPEYFRERSIGLLDWLAQFHARYSSKYPSITLRFSEAVDDTVRVVANEYLLETLFWNLWANAHQAIGDTCQIIISLRSSGDRIEVLISDNGGGFPRELKDVVFQQVYSTKEQGRGRGMLEVQDAVERLGGRIELYATGVEDFRVRIYLPKELP
jgi:signal transduction histidine kinase